MTFKEVKERLKKNFSSSTLVAEIKDKWGNEFDDCLEEMVEQSQSEQEHYNQALDDIKTLLDKK